MTTITFEEEMLNALENLAKRKLTNVETVVKEAVKRYLESEAAPFPKKYSFIGIWHSDDPNLSTRVDEVLAEGANRREGWSLSE
jgi:metal-responsive CopG/Arc/MetJ family transcriptional regulator